MATRETLASFQGRNNVTKVTNDNGAVSYLTQSQSFEEATNQMGAVSLNTFENEKKHVLFFFGSNQQEVGRLYMAQKLHGQTPDQLIEQRHTLVFFESWNPEKQAWVPCVGKGTQVSLASTAKAW